MAQLSIFDMMYPKYKISKPIRLIEFFAGYGSQALALKYLGVEFEHWKICEWAIKSIQAYKDIHFPNKFHPFGYLETEKDKLVDALYNMGVSSNYNESMTKDQLNKLSQETLAIICENIYVTNNLVNIQKVKGSDLEIIDTDKFDYILTYSFPCQDLSLAGRGKGMSDNSTRSGMLWEVERILSECKELNSLPQVLLMENVPQVHSRDNIKDFNKWQLRLEELGYKNYFQDLIATNYGIPQIRNRCFMVSILGNYSYSFPEATPLKIYFEDLMEDTVDNKYYLSEKMIQGMKKTRFQSYSYCNNNMSGKKYSKTLLTSTGERAPLFVIDKTMQKERRYTPKECFRLMGVKDEDFKKVSKNQSDSSLYHLAGDSIVVNVLMAIFKQLL